MESMLMSMSIASTGYEEKLIERQVKCIDNLFYFHFLKSITVPID